MARTVLELPPPPQRRLRVGQRVGKYRIEGRLGDGGFATVYHAYDTIEGAHVALKVPKEDVTAPEVAAALLREVRLAVRLEHPAILPIRNAAIEGGTFVIATPLGIESLEHRLRRRLSTKRALVYTEQILDALAHAHRHRVIHCDVKPANFVLFDGDVLRLSDFGIAKVALATQAAQGGGTGTIGYVAPEQALGQPSLRSDVFSTGLVVYRLFAGTLPAWPYRWPPAGYQNLRRKVRPEMIAILKKSLEVDERKRYRDCVQMQTAFLRVRRRVLR